VGAFSFSLPGGGYVLAGSAPRRVLCIAQVHNPNGWDNPLSGLSTMEPLLHDWVAGSLGDADFLSAYRDVYAERMVTWGPWIKAFGRVLEDQRIGLTPRQVAYVNFAKCWLNTDKPKKPGEKRVTQYPLMRECEKYYCIAQVSSILQPDAIIVLSGQTVLPVCGISMPHDIPWNSFSARNFQVSDADIDAMTAWLAAVQPRVRAHRGVRTASKNEVTDDLESPTLEVEPEPPFVAEPTGAETKELLVYKPSRLRGQESIPGTGATVNDYWSWAYSDVMENTQRGTFAEFLVAHVLGRTGDIRVGWDGYDVKYRGKKVEVKTSAYLQSWPLRQYSKVLFGFQRRRGWTPVGKMWDPCESQIFMRELRR
jgi:hypothetical protein